MLHLNVQVRDRQGVEARLMQSGTTLDVTGARLGGLGGDAPRSWQASAARPEGRVRRWFRKEIAHRPDARLAFLDERSVSAAHAGAPFDS